MSFFFLVMFEKNPENNNLIYFLQKILFLIFLLFCFLFCLYFHVWNTSWENIFFYYEWKKIMTAKFDNQRAEQIDLVFDARRR